MSAARCLAARRRGERGQSVIEFALMAPILMLLLLGLMEFGHGLNSYLTIVAAARDGARLGARGGDDGSIRAMISSETDHLADAGRTALDANAVCTGDDGGVCIDYPTVDGADAIAVRICYEHKLFIGVPGFPNPIRMCSETTMRIADASTSS
jgi:Flp pilus assembly protein TadG